MKVRQLVACAAIAGGLLATSALPASAHSDSSKTKLPQTGAYVHANAWHCNFFWDKCDARTSSKVLKNGKRYTSKTVKNTMTVEAHGVKASISIPKSVTVDGHKNERRLSWTNSNSWIADISTKTDPSFSTTYLTTCSDAWVFTKGVKAGASACSLG